MKTRRVFAVLIAAMLAALLSASAATDGVLGQIWEVGSGLLFHTNNVTLDGRAEFSRDGERFKTVKAHYVQDGYSSVWDYRLFTPRNTELEQEMLGDRETGFTVYGNDAGDWTDVYVVNVIKPGIYYSGTDSRQNTLVRTSAFMNQIVALTKIVANQAEPLLGEGAVTVVTDNHAGRVVKITLDENNISELMNTAFNFSAQAVITRAFKNDGESYDQRPWNMNDEDFWRSDTNWSTVANGLAYGTRSFALRSVDITVTTDGNSRLRNIEGSLSVEPDMGEAASHRVDIEFSIAASDYGDSNVTAFDPAKEGLVSYWQMISEEE